MEHRSGLGGSRHRRTRKTLSSMGHRSWTHPNLRGRKRYGIWFSPSRQISTKEYYAMTGSTRRVKRTQREKDAHGISRLESQMDTSKTAYSERHQAYVRSPLNHFQTLASFYGPGTAKARFRSYQSKQRAREEVVNVLINGGKNY